MGPLASLAQKREVLERVAQLRMESDLIVGDPERFDVVGADRDKGAFFPPILLRSRDARGARAVHSVEAFGPVSTLLGYESLEEAIELARRGEGSLAGSVITADEQVARQLVLGLAPYHGRVLVLNRHCAKESTGHGSPLAHLVHGGPGRAGGGEEMGGIRGVMHYMQRTAVQGTPDVLTAIGGRWIKGARELDPGVHPFRKPFHELRIGDTLLSAEREVTVHDIEAFAELSGDRFYAHMDEREAARNPLFGGRVAHGYFLISAAAGLFVDPPYGPVLGNYGLDQLRFVKPVKPTDRIKVRLTCKSKSLRADKGWGEVTWDTEITNQLSETVAAYHVLTMVSIHAVPDSVPAAGS
jgi:oxepin-CoA hydrolase/3-oxo-5,6-dehydrosuberyl-CoA semialdehyde dehydrogenase